MTTQMLAPASALHGQAIERSALLARRDEALAAIAAHFAIEMPAIPDAGRPRPMPPYMMGEAQVITLLAEAVAALVTELDALPPAPAATTKKETTKR